MTRNPVQALFDWKVRGVRWIEIILAVVVVALVLGVYVAKAAAARESAQIAQLEREIAETTQRVRLLRAEAARLEQPGRLETLSRTAGLAPVEMERQADASALDRLVPLRAPAPIAPVVADAEAPGNATPAASTQPETAAAAAEEPVR
ncbi:cell division protein [Brevundimonas sp. AAP58]|uniref:cell division protein FtsL n=1 Tax=Brevundimonas sp. AAP58 TaxID=1523422 RepID=UPI0006B89A07|nr:cell division protein [Brevundimonas sp. AAP58]KPF78923.1 cell division protein [Brevundimonas sp. AAP58]